MEQVVGARSILSRICVALRAVIVSQIPLFLRAKDPWIAKFCQFTLTARGGYAFALNVCLNRAPWVD